MKLALCGAAGKMGRAVTRLAASDPGIRIVGAVDAPGSPLLGKDVGELAGVEPVGVAVGADLASALLGAEVLIDFSTASGARPLSRPTASEASSNARNAFSFHRAISSSRSRILPARMSSGIIDAWRARARLDAMAAPL